MNHQNRERSGSFKLRLRRCLLRETRPQGPLLFTRVRGGRLQPFGSERGKVRSSL